MGSIAQAVSSSAVAATNSPSSEPAVPQTANGQPDASPVRAQDTVNITETGSRNVPVGVPGTKGTAFQVAYFPASSAPDALLHDANATHAAQAAVSPAARIEGLGSTSQAASAAVQANTNRSVTGVSSAGATTPGQSTPSVSAASQAKLQQLNQVLQSLGINPNQISFADRLSLLPLVNDPQAIQQAIQGLSPQSDVLNPASTPAPTAASAVSQTASNSSLANTSQAALATNSPSPTAAVSTSATSQAVPTGLASAQPAHAPARATERNGQNLNISV